MRVLMCLQIPQYFEGMNK